jgi:hypothetical protein
MGGHGGVARAATAKKLPPTGKQARRAPLPEAWPTADASRRSLHNAALCKGEAQAASRGGGRQHASRSGKRTFPDSEICKTRDKWGVRGGTRLARGLPRGLTRAGDVAQLPAGDPKTLICLGECARRDGGSSATDDAEHVSARGAHPLGARGWCRRQGSRCRRRGRSYYELRSRHASGWRALWRTARISIRSPISR